MGRSAGIVRGVVTAGSVTAGSIARAARAIPRAALVVLVTSHVAIADDPPPPDPAPWLSDAAKSAGEAARAAGTTLGGWWQEFTNAVMPGGPAGQLPAQISDDDKAFFAILDAIGLKLTDVKVGTGLLSSASYRFMATREPSDDDVQRAEQMLREYRETESGLRSRAKQRIARATLDTVATAGFSLASVEVSLQPWPDASYHVIARPDGAPSGSVPGGSVPGGAAPSGDVPGGGTPGATPGAASPTTR